MPACRVLAVLLLTIAGCAPSGANRPLPSITSVPDAFPNPVPFEAGASQFEPGDTITITSIQSNSRDPHGGTWRINGTYTLRSRETAQLAASVTGTDRTKGRSPLNRMQSTTVSRGTGPFTVLLPVAEGYPHVSFYDTSIRIGGIYFGMDNSLMRHWPGD